MPSPRSKRTTAIRPSGPRPFSMVTNSAKSAPCPLCCETIAHNDWMAEILRPLRGAALGMFAFLDLFDDLGAERIKVAGIARCDDAVIDNDLGIFPFGAGIDDISLDRLVRCHPATFGKAGLDQQPGCVADGGDDLLLIVDVLDEGKRVRFDSE